MKILVIRTDRIGEVLLTTPVLTALKEKWPEAEISMMARPQVRELIEDNPYVSEIIEYDTQDSQRGQFPGGPPGTVPQSRKITKLRSARLLWLQALRIAKLLKEKQFDITIIVNPKKEFHLAAFLAGIPIRVGFNRKWGFLLTHRVKDLKFLAQRHEIEYNLDLVRALGIEPRDKRPVLVVKDNLRDCFALDTLCQGLAMTSTNQLRPLVAIHPCTSNPKKQWPKEYFAKLGDLLIENGYNIGIVSGADEMQSAKEVISMMKNKPIDLAGKPTLSELATLFKNCKLLVSNDSGPVHIAAAVGTPVVAIFGKGDPGSRPVRWGPYGKGHVVIEKERIEDITPEEVLKVIPA